MSKLSTEILFGFANYLDRQSQLQCKLVCRSWNYIFSRIIFQRIILTSKSTHNFFDCDKQLTKLTKSVKCCSYNFQKLADKLHKACPYIEEFDFSIEYGYTNEATVLNSLWKDSLRRITAHNYIVSKLCPEILSHLTHITSNFKFVKEIGTYDFPNLRVLDLGVGLSIIDRTIISRQDIEVIRIRCPRIQKLYLREVTYRAGRTQNVSIEPFQNLDTFFLSCRAGDLGAFEELLPYFDEKLTELACIYPGNFLLFDDDQNLRSRDECRELLESQDMSYGLPYQALIDKFPHLQTLKMSYPFSFENEIYEDEPYAPVCTPENFEKMTRCLERLDELRNFELDIFDGCIIFDEDYEVDSCDEEEVKVETFYREAIHLDEILDAIPKAKYFKLKGRSHIMTTDGLKEYMNGNTMKIEDGKTDCADRITPIETLQERGQEVCESYLRNIICCDSELELEDIEEMEAGSIPWFVWANPGKRPLPITDDDEDYERRISQIEQCGLYDHYSLESLCLEGVTLRNPTFAWLNFHCPKLKSLEITESEPYPWFEIDVPDLKCLESINIAFTPVKPRDLAEMSILPLIFVIDDHGESRAFGASTDKPYREYYLEDEYDDAYKIVIRAHNLKTLKIHGKQVPI